MSRRKRCSRDEWFDRFSRYLKRTGHAASMLIVLGGCSSQSASYELSSYAPAADQLALASYHREEAQRFKQKSDELLARADLYDRLFGADSEWATGTRLLAQFYDEAGKEQARLAEQHINLAPGRQGLNTARGK
ncbi:MAG TPA: hypothetical protein VKB81_01960 [Nitrospira sp.]|jgi:hypothetical protein|nr:hypothetical protein [Nitrospira sp.]